MNNNSPSIKPEQLIRLAMLSGAILFGVVVWVQRRNTPAVATLEESAGLIRIAQVMWVVFVGAVAGLWFKRRDARAKAQPTYRILAYAAGEALALLGGVIWLITGSPSWYGPGMVFMVVVFMLFNPQHG